MVDGQYKYITDVCRFATITSVEYVKKDSRVIVHFEYESYERWLALQRLSLRKNEILFYISSHSGPLLILEYIHSPWIKNGETYHISFKKTRYNHLDVNGDLRHVFSLDDIEKSHGDEPGERGEQGTTSGIPLFSDVVDVLNVKHECGSTMTYVTAARTDKTFAFLAKWDGTPPPREFLFLLKKDATGVFKLINVCIDFSGVTFEFSYYGYVMPSDGVSFFLPTLAGPRVSQPLWQSGKPVSLCVPEPETPQAKEIVTLNMHMDVGEIHPDYSMCGVSAKSTLEREMDLIQRCKVNSYLFGREEDPKFPQMRRARLNKPKSI